MHSYAVIGKVHLLGLQRKVDNPRKTAIARKPSPKQNGGAVIAAIKSKAARERAVGSKVNQSIRNAVIARAKSLGELPTDELVRLPFEPRNRKPVSLLALEANHCRWPLCDDGDNLLGFCGEDRRDESVPYCPHHCGIAYLGLS